MLSDPPALHYYRGNVNDGIGRTVTVNHPKHNTIPGRKIRSKGRHLSMYVFYRPYTELQRRIALFDICNSWITCEYAWYASKGMVE